MSDLKWISVKDRLPENQSDPEQVIVNSHVSDAQIKNVVLCAVWWMGNFYNLERWMEVDDDETHTIKIITASHWMPLPEPPKQ